MLKYKGWSSRKYHDRRNRSIARLSLPHFKKWPYVPNPDDTHITAFLPTADHDHRVLARKVF